ncbi:hypothetical protein Tco_1109340 [Tanacetum coccineum]
MVIAKSGVGATTPVGNPHGFIIHWVVIFKNIKKVMEIVDIKNGVRSGSDNGSTSSELEARVCIQGELLDDLENVFRKKTFDYRKCNALSTTRVTASKHIDFYEEKVINFVLKDNKR